MTSTFLRFNEICGTHYKIWLPMSKLVWNLMVAPWSIINTTHILEKHLWRSCASFTFLCTTHLPSIHRSRILLRHDIIIIALKFCGHFSEFWNEDAIFWEVMTWSEKITPPGNSWKMECLARNIQSYIWKKHVVKYRHCHPKNSRFYQVLLYIYI